MMDKLEKVMKGLECCKTEDCEKCPYKDTSAPIGAFGTDELIACQPVLYADALSLLKAQEPIEPIKHLSTGQICGSCKKVLLRKYKYCPACGKAVKWDE